MTVWYSYLTKATPLEAATIVTNTALDLARRMSSEFRTDFPSAPPDHVLLRRLQSKTRTPIFGLFTRSPAGCGENDIRLADQTLKSIQYFL